jgi:Cdc6-like AAA superfamily ATPase
MDDLQKIDYENISLRLSNVFQPSAPINSEELFRGRKPQVRAVVDAINQPGRHAILFGGRGVGKTSLGKILRTKLTTVEPVPIISALITCDSSDDYSTIWEKVFSELEYQRESEALEKTNRVYLDEVSGTYEPISVVWTPYSVRRKMEQIATKGLLYVVIDEFDKVEDPDSRQLIAETIKLFSDHAVCATIIVIGVSDDAVGLIDDHRSIERCLAQIPMPRMPSTEVEQIITLGLRKVDMSIEDNALQEITVLSKGLPSYAHLLSLYASRQALDRKTLKIDLVHVQSAIRFAISQTQETIRTDYDKATYSPRKTLHTTVLLACAMARTDEFGRFQPNDVCGPMEEITGDHYTSDRFASHLKQFCDDSRGPVLKRMGGEYKWRYQFYNPLLQPYVLMKGLDAGLISKEKLELSAETDPQYPLFKKQP